MPINISKKDYSTFLKKITEQVNLNKESSKFVGSCVIWTLHCQIIFNLNYFYNHSIVTAYIQYE